MEWYFNLSKSLTLFSFKSQNISKNLTEFVPDRICHNGQRDAHHLGTKIFHLVILWRNSEGERSYLILSHLPLARLFCPSLVHEGKLISSRYMRALVSKPSANWSMPQRGFWTRDLLIEKGAITSNLFLNVVLYGGIAWLLNKHAQWYGKVTLVSQSAWHSSYLVPNVTQPSK